MSDDSADERRLFWRRYFHDHPDYTLGNPRQNDDQTPKTYTRGGKLLLYCKECLGRHIAELQREDAEAVANGTRPNPRTEAEIRRYLWQQNGAGAGQSNRGSRHGSLRSEKEPLLNHLINCQNQPRSIRSLAKEAKKEGGRQRPSNALLEMRLAQLEAQEAASPGQIATSSLLTMPMPSFPDTLLGPPLADPSISLTVTPTDGQPVVFLNSPAPSRSPSPYPSATERSPSATPFPSAHASPAPSLGSSAPSGAYDAYYAQPGQQSTMIYPASPIAPFPSHLHPHARHSSSLPNMRQSAASPYPHSQAPFSKFLVPFTPEDQAAFDEDLADITASCGFALSWVDNPKITSFFARWVPSAKVPSRNKLRRRLIPQALERYHDRARKETRGKSATLQEDGWTGINQRYLHAFMITADGKVYTTRVHDGSGEPRSGEHLADLIEAAIKDAREKWGVIIVAVCTDASGESRKARKLLAERFPEMVFPDCQAHQVQLIVGDYLGSNSSIVNWATQAEELITWIRSKTAMLALIRSAQANPLTVIRAGDTRWTSHCLAFTRLTKLMETLQLVVMQDKTVVREGGESRIIRGKKATREKAIEMIALIHKGEFWHNLARISIMLQPLAIAANTTQSTRCTLDQVLLTYGRLVMLYRSEKMQQTDPVGADAIIHSIENRWSKCDQPVFLCAVLLHPCFRTTPFRAGKYYPNSIYPLFASLYLCFFQTPPPSSFYDETEAYFHGTDLFSGLSGIVQALSATALLERRLPDPLRFWKGYTSAGVEPFPIVRLAIHIFSITANSASCERLFSTFGNILTKLRNRMGTDTLEMLAELKLAIRDEQMRDKEVKPRLKRHFGSQSAGGAQPATRAPRPSLLPETATVTSTTPASPYDALPEAPTGRRRTSQFSSMADTFRDAVKDDEDDVTEPWPWAQGGSVQGKISELFNFESKGWVDLLEKDAERSLDEELALLNLLELDAEGEEDDEDVVDIDETAADVLNFA